MECVFVGCESVGVVGDAAGVMMMRLRFHLSHAKQVVLPEKGVYLPAEQLAHTCDGVCVGGGGGKVTAGGTLRP